MSSAFSAVVLCEKPNQARIFSKAFNLTQVKMIDGCRVAYYDREGGLCVVHLSGHLLELRPPEFYAPSLRKDKLGWNLDALPVIPKGSRWPLEPKKDSRPKEQTRINALLKGIKWAFVDQGRPGEIVIAVDNDKEGELLGWETLEYYKVVDHPSISRMMYSQISEKSMRVAYDKRGSAKEWFTRYLAGLARQYADWLIGMNVTIGLSVHNTEMIPPYTALNSGRVVYAICYLLYLRHEAIKAYVPKNFYTCQVKFKTAKGETYIGTVVYPSKVLDPDIKKLTDKALAERYQSHIVKTGCGVVRSYEQENKKTPPPAGFHRTGFDRHMIRKYGMDLDAISNALQVLYDDKGLVTYPRVNVKHLDEGMHAQMPPYLAAMAKNIASAPQLTEQERAFYAKVFAVADISKKSGIWKKGIAEGESHHAIIPTDQVGKMDDLTKDQFLVYRELVDRLLVQFLPDYEYSSVIVETEVDRLICRTTGSTPLRRGWKALSQDMEEQPQEGDGEGDDSNAVIPPLSVNENVGVAATDLKVGVTKEPKLYTTDELLGDLENPKKFVNNQELMKRIKQMQIGTDGTRQKHVVDLVPKGFAELRPRKGSRKVKELVPTQKLLALIEIAPGYFKYPETSAYWEDAFNSIQAGEMTLEAFLDKQSKLITRFFSELRSGQFKLKSPTVSVYKNCPEPACGGLIFPRKTAKGFPLWSCGKCKTAYLDNDGEVGRKMTPGGTASGPKPKWIPPQGTPRQRCTSCNTGWAYHKKVEGKSWSVWECQECEAAFFDNKGALGKKLEKNNKKKKS